MAELQSMVQKRKFKEALPLAEEALAKLGD